MYLIWDGDILFLYACVGSIAVLLHHWPAKRLILFAIALMTLGIAVNAGIQAEETLLEIAIFDGSATNEQKSTYAENGKLTEDFAKDEAKMHTLSYPAMVQYRVTEEWWLPALYVIFTFLETMPLMMLGIALYKNGFITGAWETPQYWRISWVYLGAGAIISAILVAIIVTNDFRPSLTVTIHIVFLMIPQFIMTIGFAALIIRWAKHAARSALGARIAAIGRMALTNYIMTSVIMTTLFYGYGFALWGKFNLTQLWVFVITAWLVMLWWSKPWLKRFQYGPLEWAWRSLTKWQLQPMRR